MKIKIFQDPRTQMTWALRLLFAGDTYGANDALTVTGEPLVEVFDTRFPHTDLGQFVSRYYASTLLESNNEMQGLNLCGGVPSWHLSGPGFAVVREWLAQHVELAEA